MLAGMPAHIFQDWQRYFCIEPFGEYREELRHGQKMAMYANYHRDTKARPEPFRACEFMNFTDQPPQEEEIKLSDEEIEMALKGIFGV